MSQCTLNAVVKQYVLLNFAGCHGSKSSAGAFRAQGLAVWHSPNFCTAAAVRSSTTMSTEDSELITENMTSTSH